MQKKFLAGVIAGVSGFVFSACAVDEDGNPVPTDDGVVDVYATTGYIADAVANIAPEANVVTMVGPGGDPHTYQPSTRDIETMDNSDVILWNGLYLEAQMEDQLESYGDRQLAVAETLDESELLPWPEGSGFDPHVWNSPTAWQDVVLAIAQKIGEIDPENSDTYIENARSYNAEIQLLHDELTPHMEAINKPRTLITGHDAFGYFGDTYNLEVLATDFVSTEAAMSATEISELADFIAENEIPVIFQDNQANPQAITSLKEAVEARGFSVEISSEELFADSLGPTAPVDTYLGVLRHNAEAVFEGLS